MNDVAVGSGALLGDSELSTTTESTRARLSPTLAATKRINPYEVEATLSVFAEAMFAFRPLAEPRSLIALACLTRVRSHPASPCSLKDASSRVALPKFCPTSKMSHDRSGRAACFRTIRIRLLQFGNRFDSTRRDRCGRWLWRLVGRL